MNENHKLRVKVNGGTEHDLFVSTTNLLVLAAGGLLWFDGNFVKYKLTTYLSPTSSNFYMDQVPLLEINTKEN